MVNIPYFHPFAFTDPALQHIFFCNSGNPGHGSRFIENTAGAKVHHLMNKLLGFREEQKKIYEADKSLTLGKDDRIYGCKM